ncbi:hypothetical protein GCM10028807_22980 [Spirosoma daeguense]
MKQLSVLFLLSLSIGTGAQAQNLFLNQNGDVGIGTKTPSARFNVSATDENAMRIDGVNPYILFRNVNEPDPNGQMREYGFIRTWTTDPFNSAGYHGLEIGVPPSASGQPAKHLLLSTSYIPRMTILANGNVGIGTTNPTYKLDVAGNIRIAGASNRIEGFTNIVGTTLFEGTAFDGIVGIQGSAVNALVHISNTADETSGAGISVQSSDLYGTIRAFNSRVTSGGSALLAETMYGRYSGHFVGGRILVEGGRDGSRSAGIEFRNLKTFTTGFPTTQAYVGMRDDNELGIYGFPLGDWILRMNIYSGSICSRSAIALCSDQRLKRDFEPLTGSLTKLTSVQGQHYFWKEVKMPGLQTGFVAQEIQPIFPELVRTDDNGFMSVDYTGFVPHLVEAVKELKKTTDSATEALKADNQLLRTQLEQVMKRLAVLESQSLASQVAAIEKR